MSDELINGGDGSTVAMADARIYNPDTSYTIQHAKRELALINKHDSNTEDDVLIDQFWSMLTHDVIELLEVFDKQGHSGMSAPKVLQLFSKLGNHEILSPLLGDDSEWCEIGTAKYQNNRDSKVFKKIQADGTVRYSYTDSVILRDIKNGGCWSGSARLSDGTLLGSHDFTFTFPFTPKRYYIDVEEILDDKGEFTGYKIIDETQVTKICDTYIRV